uniref:Uncharacterized protein n=1 Tax=Nymphaea colorata TaxID=210225 RepID=A0A5K1CGJ9_9MAGN
MPDEETVPDKIF